MYLISKGEQVCFSIFFGILHFIMIGQIKVGEREGRDQERSSSGSRTRDARSTTALSKPIGANSISYPISRID